MPSEMLIEAEQRADDSLVHESSLDSEAFRNAFRHHPAGVTVITADPGDGPVGLTASSVISISADPPLLAFSVSDQSSSAEALRRATTVVVHFLCADNLDLALLCASNPAARFSNSDLWERLKTHEPRFKAAPFVRGEIVERIRAGLGTLMIVRALSAEPAAHQGAASEALVYHDRGWHRLASLGHSGIEH